MKYYKEGKIALRWRVEREVISGKGQFVCASTRCESTKSLKSWEVNFGYIEDGEKKNELVKVRLCPECSDKLNYKTKKRAAKRQEKKHKKKRRTEREEEESDEHVSDGEDQSSSEGIFLYKHDPMMETKLDIKQKKRKPRRIKKRYLLYGVSLWRVKKKSQKKRSMKIILQTCYNKIIMFVNVN